MLQYMWVPAGHMHACITYTRDLTSVDSVNSVNTDKCTGTLVQISVCFSVWKHASICLLVLCALKHYPEAREYPQGSRGSASSSCSQVQHPGHYALFKASSSWQWASYQARLHTTLRILVLLYFSMSLQILFSYSSVTSKNWKKQNQHTFKINKKCNNYKKLHDVLHCETKKIILIKETEFKNQGFRLFAWDCEHRPDPISKHASCRFTNKPQFLTVALALKYKAYLQRIRRRAPSQPLSVLL